jgi:hypothetical protein
MAMGKGAKPLKTVMAIKTRRAKDPPWSKWRMKIDQALELAALARLDGDIVDEQRWMKEVERLKKIPEKEFKE